MQNHRIKTILFIAFLFLIVGCSKFSSNKTPPTTTKDLYSGTDSLEIEIIEKNPPEEVYDNSVFNLGLLLRNQGPFNIESGYIALSLEEDFMSIQDWDVEDVLGSPISKNVILFNINGKNLENREGDKGYVTASILTKEIPKSQPKEHNSPLILTTCYPYQTILSETVCVDTDIFNLNEENKACEIKDFSSSSQGAPLAITNVKVNMLPLRNSKGVKPEFIIEIENQGPGQILLFNSYTIEKACSSESLTKQELNKVSVWARLSNDNLQCKSTSSSTQDDENIAILDLSEKNNQVRCVLEKGIDDELGTYTTPLTIQLNYGYTYSISKDIKIRRVS
jgi:hypothetical protein